MSSLSFHRHRLRRRRRSRRTHTHTQSQRWWQRRWHFYCLTIKYRTKIDLQFGIKYHFTCRIIRWSTPSHLKQTKCTRTQHRSDVSMLGFSATRCIYSFFGRLFDLLVPVCSAHIRSLSLFFISVTIVFLIRKRPAFEFSMICAILGEKRALNTIE